MLSTPRCNGGAEHDYTEITSMFNWVKTFMLMAAITALFIVIGGMIGGRNGMMFALLMVFYLVPYVMLSYRSGEVSTNAGGLIIWPAKTMLLVGFFLLAWQGVSEIIKKIAIMTGNMDDPNPYISQHEQAALEGEALVEELKS